MRIFRSLRTRMLPVPRVQTPMHPLPSRVRIREDWIPGAGRLATPCTLPCPKRNEPPLPYRVRRGPNWSRSTASPINPITQGLRLMPRRGRPRRIP